MVVHADRQANGAVVVAGEVGKAFARVNDIAIVAQVIFSCFRTAVVGNGVGGTVDAAGSAAVAKSRDASIDWLISGQRNRCRYAAHAKKGTQPGMNDGTMPA